MSTNPPPVDLELKKAFQELQVKMIETAQKLRLADMQADALRRSIQHSTITNQEISALDKQTRTFEGVGRMFVLTSIPDVQNMLVKKVSNAEEKIKSLETNKEYLEKSLKESEDNLREMIQVKQNK